MDEDVAQNNPNLVLLSIAKHAIDIENERKKNIEVRAGVALGFHAATMVFFLQEAGKEIGNDKQMLSNFASNVPIADLTRCELFAIIDILLWGCMIGCITVSVIKFLDVFGMKQDYKSLRLDEIIDMALEDEDEALFALDAAGVYMEQLECNSLLNDGKAHSYEIALLFFKYAIWTVFIRYVISAIVMSVR